MRLRMSFGALRFAAAAVAFVFAAGINAQLTPANLTRYTVIQRDSNSSAATFTITGTCPTGTANIQMQLVWQDSAGKVVAPFSWLQLASTVSGTSFSSTATGMPVGGPYIAQLRAVDGSGTTLASSAIDSNVLVGDLWLCEGQSNMQLYSGFTTNPDVKHIHIRNLFYNGNPRAAHYTINDTSHWSTGLVNGPCLGFAQKVYQTSGVPIGILYGSAGGSAFSAWDTSWFPTTKKFVSQSCNWKIAGFLWYQGEAEDPIDSGLVYQAKFDSILRTPLRTLSGRPNLPICDVQLESWTGTNTFGVDPTRRMHWVIIRDRQELVGREDAACGTAPIWDAVGLHIGATDMAKVGPRAAARMLNTWLYSNRAPHQAPGPRFKKAWFQDQARSKIVVQFQEVAGRITNPADPNHLGFYVMKPAAFSNTDSLAFAYNDTLGRTAPMRLKVTSVDTLGTDKVVITLTTPVADSLTVGYGSSINFFNGTTTTPTLTPVTDSSGIPLCTFFNRPILPYGASGVTEEVRAVQQPALMSINGTALTFKTAAKVPAVVSIFNVNGRLVRQFSTTARSVDLRKGLGNGLYTVRAELQGRRAALKMLVN